MTDERSNEERAGSLTEATSVAVGQEDRASRRKFAALLGALGAVALTGCDESSEAERDGPVDLRVATQALAATADVKIADSVANLRTLVGTAASVAVLSGHSTALDGGGGIFVWVSDTTSTDNVGTIVVPTATPRTGCWKRIYEHTINVRWFGAVGDGTTSDRASILAAFAAADAAGASILWFPAGVYNVATGLPLAGFRAQLRGVGARGQASTEGTVFVALTQTGPIVDFTGWLGPLSFLGQLEHSGFGVKGNGVASAANIGIKISGSIVNTCFRNISINNTGGTGLFMTNGPLICKFENIAIGMPVAAKANNTPWLKATGQCNGNIFDNVTLRSEVSSADVGVAGAWVFEADSSFSPDYNTIRDCSAEYLHPPTNGTILHLAANINTVTNFRMWDCGKEAGATGTSMIRLAPAAIQNYGGNTIEGAIPGAETVDTGVSVLQSRNAIHGVKGYNGGSGYAGGNVTLHAGVGYTSVRLSGGVSGVGGSAPAVIDNTGGITTNVVVDDMNNEDSRNTHVLTQAPNSASGNLTLGKNGAAIFQNGAGGDLYIQSSPGVATRTLMRHHGGAQTSAAFAGAFAPALTLYPASPYPALQVAQGTIGMQFGNSGPAVLSGAGTPEGVHSAAKGSLYMRTDGGAGTSLYVKESGTSNTGWVAK